jgi:hypothetical protein
MMVLIPSKYSVAQVVGFIKGRGGCSAWLRRPGR